MKNTTVQISFDLAKLKALQRYMRKKDADLQSELDEALQKLYEKYVPKDVREYIEGETDDPRPAQEKRSSTRSAPISGSAPPTALPGE